MYGCALKLELQQTLRWMLGVLSDAGGLPVPSSAMQPASRLTPQCMGA